MAPTSSLTWRNIWKQPRTRNKRLFLALWNMRAEEAPSSPGWKGQTPVRAPEPPLSPVCCNNQMWWNAGSEQKLHFSRIAFLNTDSSSSDSRELWSNSPPPLRRRPPSSLNSGAVRRVTEESVMSRAPEIQGPHPHPHPHHSGGEWASGRHRAHISNSNRQLVCVSTCSFTTRQAAGS